MASRQAALERELEQLVKINSTVSNLISTIRLTRSNISRMNNSNNNTHDLLDQWIRILSQTNFTHEMINDSSWNGVESNKMAEVDETDDSEERLEQELERIQSENKLLQLKIDQKTAEREARESRANEVLNRRRKELGLMPRSRVYK